MPTHSVPGRAVEGVAEQFTMNFSLVCLLQKGNNMFGIILMVVIGALLIGAFPRWNHSRNWGYYPSGGLGLVLVIVLVLLLLGRI